MAGSFRVYQFATRSPRRSATIAAYSPNRSAVSRASHPPASSTALGISQWNSVGNGVTPRSSSRSTNRE